VVDGEEGAQEGEDDDTRHRGAVSRTQHSARSVRLGG
jgi:hypothetical protein